MRAKRSILVLLLGSLSHTNDAKTGKKATFASRQSATTTARAPEPELPDEHGWAYGDTTTPASDIIEVSAKLQQRGEHMLAAEGFAQALRIVPNTASTRVNFATSLDQAGHALLALSHLEQVLDATNVDSHTRAVARLRYGVLQISEAMVLCTAEDQSAPERDSTQCVSEKQGRLEKGVHMLDPAEAGWQTEAGSVDEREERRKVKRLVEQMMTAEHRQLLTQGLVLLGPEPASNPWAVEQYERRLEGGGNLHRAEVAAVPNYRHAEIKLLNLAVTGEYKECEPVGRSTETTERLAELEWDGIVHVRGRSPEQLLKDLLTSALSLNLTNPKAVQMINRNLQKGRLSCAKGIDTWSTALSKALDRAHKLGKTPREERRRRTEKAQVDVVRYQEHSIGVVFVACSGWLCSLLAAAGWFTQRRRLEKIRNRVEQLSRTLRCPISISIMADPVIVPETGHTYERAEITKWLRIHDTDPLTNDVLTTKKTVSNISLRHTIEAQASLRSALSLPTSEGKPPRAHSSS